MTGEIKELARCLQEAGCEMAAMESTGVYRKPLYNLFKLLKASFIPGREQCELRDLTRYRKSLRRLPERIAANQTPNAEETARIVHKSLLPKLDDIMLAMDGIILCYPAYRVWMQKHLISCEIRCFWYAVRDSNPRPSGP